MENLAQAYYNIIDGQLNKTLVQSDTILNTVQFMMTPVVSY